MVVGYDLFARFHVACEPDVGAHYGSFANGYASQYGCVAVDDDVVAENRMPGIVLDGISAGIERKTFGSQCDTLVKFHVVSDDTCRAYHNAGAVVDGEVTAYLCGRMDVDARFAVGHFRDDARNERYAENVEFMGDSMAGEGFDDRVATDDFSVALCGRIAQIGGFYVGCQRAAAMASALA